MKRLAAAIVGVLLITLLLGACSREEETSTASEGGFIEARPAPAPTVAVAPGKAIAAGAPAAMPAPRPPEAAGVSSDASQSGSGSASGQLDVAERQVISTASVVLEVADVARAVTEVRTTAQNFGGFVENLSSSGDADRQRATVTIRVPQARFLDAMDHIAALGEVVSQNIGSQDVTEQFIDLRARLQSAQRQEQSLLTLLQRAQNVTEILTIERELTRTRGEIERLQGQLNFLERRVDLATITVTLTPPDEGQGTAPSASLGLEVDDVARTVERVKAFVASQNGVVDGVFISERGEEKRAEVSLRLFPADFSQALVTLASEGKVLTREVREGTPPPSGARPPSKPNAFVSMSLSEDRGIGGGTIAVIVIAAVGGAALALAFGYLMFRVGRGRRVAG